MHLCHLWGSSQPHLFLGGRDQDKTTICTFRASSRKQSPGLHPEDAEEVKHGPPYYRKGDWRSENGVFLGTQQASVRAGVTSGFTHPPGVRQAWVSVSTPASVTHLGQLPSFHFLICKMETLTLAGFISIKNKGDDEGETSQHRGLAHRVPSIMAASLSVPRYFSQPLPTKLSFMS